MPARIAPIIVILLCGLARADTTWLLARDHGKLVLLSPAPVVHVSLEPRDRWEGRCSTLDLRYAGPDLVITLHRDWASTAWWFDLAIAQRPDGTILACWYSTGNETSVVFARYSSFHDAWRDAKFRRSIQPVLCDLDQTLPDVEETWGWIEMEWW